MSNLANIALRHGALLFAPWPTAESTFDADSPEAIETGRHHLFDPVECCRMGRCS